MREELEGISGHLKRCDKYIIKEVNTAGHYNLVSNVWNSWEKPLRDDENNSLM